MFLLRTKAYHVLSLGRTLLPTVGCVTSLRKRWISHTFENVMDNSQLIRISCHKSLSILLLWMYKNDMTTSINFSVNKFIVFWTSLFHDILRIYCIFCEDNSIKRQFHISFSHFSSKCYNVMLFVFYKTPEACNQYIIRLKMEKGYITA